MDRSRPCRTRRLAARCRRLLPILAALIFPALALPAAAQDVAAPSAAERLAQKYAPIAYLKRQSGPCDADGEPFLPAPVEVVLGDPAVALRQAPGRAVVSWGVGIADLGGRNPAHYLDLPGRARTPGCGYERRFKARMGDLPPTVYAHVATEETEEGETALALQYWFYYYFNQFNDLHEGDWEMIQIRFDAGSAAAALEQEPVEVAYAQHKGGETAAWDDPKLEREGDHPVVYVASGSHAAFYGPAVWIGWGNQGAGLGCDVTTGPSERVAPVAVLVPDEIAGPDDPFAWVTFNGHWGERDTWVYDGPKGPNLNAKWTKPITWQEGLRADSLRVAAADVLGPAPSDLFCELVADGSAVFTLAKPYPWAVGGALAALALFAGWLIRFAFPTLRAAWAIFAPHLGTFVAIGAVIVPITIAVSGVHYLLTTDHGFAARFPTTEDNALLNAAVGTAVYLQRLLQLVLVTPAVIAAVAEVTAGRRPGFRRAYGVALGRWRPLLGAAVVYVVATTLLSASVIGIPVAVWLLVRWAFWPQAVVLDGRSGRRALTGSAAVVTGRWWRLLAIGLVLLFVGAALGPVVSLALLVFANAPLDLANGASGVAYAITQPFAVTGATVVYLRLRDERRPRAVGASGRAVAPAPGTG